MTVNRTKIIQAQVLVATLLLAAPVLALSKEEQAANHYLKAAQLLDDLQQVPELELGLEQYRLVIDAFASVYKADPASDHCDDALFNISEIYSSMAERFMEDKYRKTAIESYAYMIREYPQSKLRQRALDNAGKLRNFVYPSDSALTILASSPGAPRNQLLVSMTSDAFTKASSLAGTVIQPPNRSQIGRTPATIARLRHHSYTNGTRIVLDMNQHAAVIFNKLKNPQRLYIDFLASQTSSHNTKSFDLQIHDNLISTAKLAQNRHNKARLVLNLNQAIDFDMFWLDNPIRLVLDVRVSGTPQAARTIQALKMGSSPLPAPQAASATATGRLSLTRALGLKLDRIVIDAGHGGHDTGSIGSGGTREKDVVLDIARKLGERLEKELKAEVIYTRKSDVFIPLEDRPKIANIRQADLLISIHCNSAEDSRVRGVETYYLNFTKDAWELSVASRENAAANRSIHELEDLVEKIALEEKIEESQEFASSVQKQLYAGISGHSASIRDRGIRKAPFMVLIGAEMPAILAEIGFLSNRADELLLEQSSFREEVSDHLFKGIAAYANSLGVLTMQQTSQSGSAQLN